MIGSGDDLAVGMEDVESERARELDIEPDRLSDHLAGSAGCSCAAGRRCALW